MAIKFNVGNTQSNTAPETPTPVSSTTPTPDQSTQAVTPPPNPAGNTAPPKVGGHQTPAPWLKTGDAQRTQMQQVAAHQQLRSKLRSGAREFWLKVGEFAKVVFLDGTLIGKDVFDTPVVDVHMLQISGDWTKVVCNQASEGRCLICEGDRQPSSVQLFTVINLMPYTIQNGPRRGQTLNGRLQLMAVPFSARSKLVRRAEKNGGTLAGGVFQFARTDAKGARIGDDIEFDKAANLSEVISAFPMLSGERDAQGKWVEKPTTVIDYGTAYPHLTNAEIASLRPDLASMAGWSQHNAAADPFSTANGEVDDSELPF